MDVDLLAFLAASLTYEWPVDEIYINDYSYLVYSVDAIQSSILYNFGIENFDLSGASGYETYGPGTITILAAYYGDSGDGEYIYTQNNDGWEMTFEAYEREKIASISVNLNSEAVITSFDITLNTVGDISGDGEIETNDAILLLKHLAGYDVDTTLGIADVNGDNVVDVGDAVLILQHVAGYNIGL